MRRTVRRCVVNSVPQSGLPAGEASANRNKILFVLLIALAMSLIQVSSVNVALDAIGSALNASSSQLQWVLSGYALMIGLVLVPAGRLGDLFGQAMLFVIGLALFTIASAACGLASDPVALNVLRLAQGAASGLFSPQVTGLIQKYFSGQARAKAFALFGLVVSVSVAAGPILAGLIIDFLGPEQGWRATFGINVPLGVIGVALAVFWLPFSTERAELGRRHVTQRRRRGIDLDPVGMVLLITAVLCVMLPFMIHGNPWRWTLLPAAVVLLIAWVRWETVYEQGGRAPMVHMSMFRIRSFSFSTAIMALQFLGITSQFVVIAMFLQAGLGEAAIAAGMIGLPNALASAVASMWSGKYTIRYGRQIMAGSLFLMVIGLAAAIVVLLNLENGWSFWWLSLAFMVTGIGQGAMGSASQTQAMLEIPPTDGGTAGGITQTSQRIATAIGNAVITAILLGILGGSTEGAAVAVWVDAVIASYVAIIAILLVGLAVSIAFVIDLRKHPLGQGT